MVLTAVETCVDLEQQWHLEQQWQRQMEAIWFSTYNTDQMLLFAVLDR
jgi:hypothetical protein